MLPDSVSARVNRQELLLTLDAAEVAADRSCEADEGQRLETHHRPGSGRLREITPLTSSTSSGSSTHSSTPPSESTIPVKIPKPIST